MKLLRNAASLRRSGCRRCAGGSDPRRPICASVAAATTCCRDRSKYGTVDPQTTSISSSLRSLGYRYSRRTRAPARDCPDEPDDRPGAEVGGTVLAVRGEVLGDEDDLLGGELVDFGEDLGYVAAALLAAERRDGAEAALAVAAFGDLDVAHGAADFGRGRLSRSNSGTGVTLTGMSCGLGPAPAVAGRLCPEADAEPGHLIDLGQCGGQFLPLGHAPRDDEATAVAPPLVEGEHRVDRLLASRLDERARVDDDEIGRLASTAEAQPVGEQVPTSLSESTWFLGQPSVST